LQQVSQATPDDLMVVEEKDPNHRASVPARGGGGKAGSAQACAANPWLQFPS
jgi:hypothetical protein